MLNIDAWTATELLPVLRRTASANGSGVDVSAFQGKGKIIVAAGAAAAGTNPTLDITFQDSADNSSWATITAPFSTTISQVTNASSVQAIDVNWDAVRKYIRVVVTIGGTSTPTFDAGVIGLGRNVTV